MHNEYVTWQDQPRIKLQLRGITQLKSTQLSQLEPTLHHHHLTQDGIDMQIPHTHTIVKRLDYIRYTSIVYMRPDNFCHVKNIYGFQFGRFAARHGDRSIAADSSCKLQPRFQSLRPGRDATMKGISYSLIGLACINWMSTDGRLKHDEYLYTKIYMIKLYISINDLI